MLIENVLFFYVANFSYFASACYEYTRNMVYNGHREVITKIVP